MIPRNIVITGRQNIKCHLGIPAPNAINKIFLSWGKQNNQSSLELDFGGMVSLGMNCSTIYQFCLFGQIT